MLLVLGAAAAGVHLARRLHLTVRVTAAVLAPTIVMIVMPAVEALLRPLVPGTAAPWVGRRTARDTLDSGAWSWKPEGAGRAHDPIGLRGGSVVQRVAPG